MRFFESGHGPPLLRYFEQLFLDVGVGHLSSVLFAFARLGPILFSLLVTAAAPFVR